MITMTITEALAELKTIAKRLVKKREFISGYVARQDIVKDPLEKDGGSVTAILRERQAMNDLQERILGIRRAITAKNMEVTLTIGSRTRTIADWLVWRREVAPPLQAFLGTLNAAVRNIREQTVRKGAAIVESGQGTNQNDIVVNMSELGLAQEIEALEETLGTLDGLLSLKNATTFIEI